jgi:hypothetical protein
METRLSGSELTIDGEQKNSGCHQIHVPIRQDYQSCCVQSKLEARWTSVRVRIVLG